MAPGRAVIIEISPAAERDLDEMAVYGTAEWGEDRASAYVDRVEDEIDRLARFPGMGISCGVDVRRWRYERHLIFYRVVGDTLRVERILHERQLPPKVL